MSFTAEAERGTQFADTGTVPFGHGLDASFLVETPDATAGFGPLMYIGGHTTTGINPHFDPAGAISEKLLRRAPSFLLRVLLPDAPTMDWGESGSVPTRGQGPLPTMINGASTGESIREFAQTIHDVWRGCLSETPVFGDTAPTAFLVDVPAVLQAARRQAGLPVQDLAAMVGISRRQFYNLVSGHQETVHVRTPRITRVADAISQVSRSLGGNSRRTRQILLARLGGDSIYAASVSDDQDRVRLAVERAMNALHDGQPLGYHLPPSARASQQEAVAVRDYLRASRDSSVDTD